MKIVEFLRGIEITVSGSYAIYFLMCVGYVTCLGLYGIGKYIFHWIQKIIAQYEYNMKQKED